MITEPEPTLEMIRAEIRAMEGADYSSPSRQCDMVMKGGITSGVVYPLTIAQVARNYRLRNVGGASAGAIAACLAAAAEHRRQTVLHQLEQQAPTDDAEQTRLHRAAGSGFAQLATLPIELGEKLATLFQPSEGMEKPFALLDAGLDPDKKVRKRRMLTALVRQRLSWFVVGAAISMLIALFGIIVVGRMPNDGGDWGRLVLALLPGLLIALVVGVLAAAAGMALFVMRSLPEHGYGLCDGLHRTGDRKDAALTEWLTTRIDEVAGRPGIESPLFTPLTLGDLWGDEALTSWDAALGKRFVGSIGWRLSELREVDLEVMVTDLVTRRPYRLPFDNGRFMFAPSEMLRYFPAKVVATMQRQGATPALHPDTGEVLYGFPMPRHLPVVVLARMSLSFPGLIAAVPLYCVDYSDDAQPVVRHWISDGGISSNFPIHFFDSVLPSRPTFGIDLQPQDASHPEPVRRRRIGRTTTTVNPRVNPLTGLPSFVGSIMDTMQNWSDTSLATLKGYVDRVVEVRLTPDEGGMNLRMKESTILRLAYRGLLAGRTFDPLPAAEAAHQLPRGEGVEHGSAQRGFDWDAHRIARYRLAMTRLYEALDHFHDTWTHDVAGEMPYPELVQEWHGDGESWLADDRTPDLAATAALITAVEAWQAAGYPALKTTWPKPAPDLRMSPK
ncbi:MAG: patatin-like phospholipase family protein [Actinomycetota bacterium]|nr:patatin-like phospholipase family protein [Actinomycetota bacterium]